MISNSLLLSPYFSSVIGSLNCNEKHKSLLSSGYHYHLRQPQNPWWKREVTPSFLCKQGYHKGSQKRAMRKKAQESDLGSLKSPECSQVSVRHSPLWKQVSLPVLDGTSHWQYALFSPQRQCFQYYEFQYLPSWWEQGWLRPEAGGTLAEVHDLGQTPREQRI